MITEDYVSFEVAKLLKEKGFDWECIGYYVDDESNEVKYSFLGETNSTWENRCCSAPTHQMAMKWLREIHNYAISICLDSYVVPFDNQYYILIRRRKDKYETIGPCEQVYFDTYEEAVEAALKYCLENLI